MDLYFQDQQVLGFFSFLSFKNTLQMWLIYNQLIFLILWKSQNNNIINFNFEMYKSKYK